MIDEKLKEYWKLFMPVAMRLFETEYHKRHEEIYQRYGISHIHFKYILTLDTGEHTLKQLSECLYFDKANTTRAIKFLEDKGYVYDDRESKTSRKYNIYLTEEGKEIAKYLREDLNKTFNILFDGISNEEMMAYINVVDRMCQNIDGDGVYTQTLQGLKKTISEYKEAKQ